MFNSKSSSREPESQVNINDSLDEFIASVSAEYQHQQHHKSRGEVEITGISNFELGFQDLSICTQSTDEDDANDTDNGSQSQSQDDHDQWPSFSLSQAEELSAHFELSEAASAQNHEAGYQHQEERRQQDQDQPRRSDSSEEQSGQVAVAQADNTEVLVQLELEGMRLKIEALEKKLKKKEELIAKLELALSFYCVDGFD